MSLYQHPDHYASVFGINERDEEEVVFYEKLLLGTSCLSLGCGDGSLEYHMARGGEIGISAVDSSLEMIQAARKLMPNNKQILHCSFEDFRHEMLENSVSTILSPNLSLNYLTNTKAWHRLLKELYIVSLADVVIYFDVLIACQPIKYQGIIERGRSHELRFYDLISEDSFFSTIMTELEITHDGKSISRQAPLTLIHPEKFKRFVLQQDFQVDAFYACHDINSATTSPPLDARRAVIKLTKKLLNNNAQESVFTSD